MLTLAVRTDARVAAAEDLVDLATLEVAVAVDSVAVAEADSVEAVVEEEDSEDLPEAVAATTAARRATSPASVLRLASKTYFLL